MNGYTETDRQVLTRLQRGIELVERPFEGFPMSAPQVVELIRRAQDEGLMRRFGVVFDARRLGYRSILCALATPAKEVEEKAAVVAAEPGVTHCYERRPLVGGREYPALWFTLALLHEEFGDGLARLRARLESPGSTLFELPALRRFKIDVVFDLRTIDRDETFPGAVPAAEFGAVEFRDFSKTERAIVRSMDQQIPISETPFEPLAERMGMTAEGLLEILRQWQREGVLRRIAAVLRHHAAGFKANAMCVWPVEGDILEVGRRMAEQPEVTHCYQRPRGAAIPFDLYAMIHTESWESTRRLFEDLSGRCRLRGGEMFASHREFKKSSMQYFK